MKNVTKLLQIIVTFCGLSGMTIASDSMAGYTTVFSSTSTNIPNQKDEEQMLETESTKEAPWDLLHVLPDGEFEKTKEAYRHVFDGTQPLKVSHDKSLIEWPSEGPLGGIEIIPVPERCALVMQVDNEKPVRLEITGLYACVGIAAWNANYIGAVHWDNVPDRSCLKKFIEDVTMCYKLADRTRFVLTTNYLSHRLIDVFEMIRQLAPQSIVYLDAAHRFGGFVAVDKNHNEYISENTRHLHFVEGSNKKRFMPHGKSLSLSSSLIDDLIPYTFDSHEPGDRAEEYFMYLDASLFGNDEVGYLPPKEYWMQNFPDHIHSEPAQLWNMLDRMYKAFGGHQNRPVIMMPLIYLY